MSICTFVTVIVHFEFGFCSHFLMFPTILYNRILSRVIFCPAFQRPFAAILRPRRSWIDDIVRESGTAQGAPKASHFLEAKRFGEVGHVQTEVDPFKSPESIGPISWVVLFQIFFVHHRRSPCVHHLFFQKFHAKHGSWKTDVARLQRISCGIFWPKD